MIEQDTIRLLRECDSGVKMGVDAIEDVMDCADDRALKQMLVDCKKEHEKLGREIQTMLNRYQDEGKDPNPIVKGMSWLKTGHADAGRLQHGHPFAEQISQRV